MLKISLKGSASVFGDVCLKGLYHLMFLYPGAEMSHKGVTRKMLQSSTIFLKEAKTVPKSCVRIFVDKRDTPEFCYMHVSVFGLNIRRAP